MAARPADARRATRKSVLRAAEASARLRRASISMLFGADFARLICRHGRGIIIRRGRCY